MLTIVAAAFAAFACRAHVHSPPVRDARRAREFVYQRASEPASLNPIVSDGHQSVDIQFHVLEPLLERDLDTYAWRPALAGFLGGSVLVESVFQVDGLGLLGVRAVVTRDYNVIMALLFTSSLVLLIGNLIGDALYAAIDPRVRFA